MRKQLPVRALSYLKTHMQKKKWRRVVTVLSCIVVSCTTYALILPAITMTQQTHVHTPEDCYERVLICGQEQAILICGAAEGEGAHLHTQDCFDEAGNAVCGLDESADHEHTDDCYRTGWVLVCGQEESAEAQMPHEHTDGCYEDQLVCELEEHQHSLAAIPIPRPIWNRPPYGSGRSRRISRGHSSLFSDRGEACRYCHPQGRRAVHR